MDLIWDSPSPLTAADVRDGLGAARRDLAVTTVLTVLGRLENKGFLTRDRAARPHQFRATTTRSSHMADLMHQVLGASSDRQAVLARFVGRVSADEVDALRRMLDGAWPR